MIKNRKTPVIGSEDNKRPSKRARREMIFIIALSVIFMAVYFGATESSIPVLAYIVTGAYMVFLAVFSITYICYNYAFTRKSVSVDDLPDTWSMERKNDYIEKGKLHAEKSRWMIFVIFPLIITFMADFLYLFFLDGLIEKIIK